MSDTRPSPPAGLVRLGYPSSVRTAHEVVAASGFPPDGVRLAPYDLNDPFAALRGGELDVLIVKFEPREADLAVGGILGLEARAAVLAATHPLAERTSLSIEELADHDGFACPGSFPGYLWDMIVPPRTPGGRVFHRRHHAASIAEMMGVLLSHDAVHISVASLADMAPPAVRVIRIHDLPPTPVRLAWRKDIGVPDRVAAFVRAVEAGRRGAPGGAVTVGAGAAGPLHGARGPDLGA
ncbi:LysR substrate-binding domain-containing protein [Streptomyces sp. NPDC047000]|uniref:LysR substrate-binding domain-containing protein n=1 Tax=Streptomyces sp. NPDC047000 TaxID=3155474 RepID=UPI0033C68DF2